ncbi:hypothetical protein GW17_00007757 [Ensete ventricosum]|nr:hypothetical protein GW17_00007757 [Ensete ventricosum]RZR88473.1 hypothetical protein BHM03_00016071 [Ensete ventricosum]
MASSEMVSSSNPEPERDAEESNLNPNPVAPPVAPVVCLMRFASDSAAGGFMGSIFGYGVAGCCTGVALSFPGAPHAMLQSCLTFGAFSFVMEGLNKQQPASAQCISSGQEITKSPKNVLPPFTLHLPPTLMEGFSSFCRSLSKPWSPIPR